MHERDEKTTSPMKETDWRWDAESGKWRLVDVGDVHPERLIADVTLSTGSLGCAGAGVALAAVGWLLRRLRKRRQPTI